MANFIVTNLNDSGAGSLRAALAAAEATPEADSIAFAASLAGGTVTITEALSAGLDAGAITVTGDVDGDGSTDISIRNLNGGLVTVETGASLTLNSLRLSAVMEGATASGVVSPIANRGTLTLTNVSILDTFVTAVNSQTAATVHNYAGATLTVSEVAFAGGVVRGSYGSLTVDGGDAIFGVLNRGTLSIDMLGFQGGTAFGGSGGNGVAGIPGGDGGAAVIGVLNEGMIEASAFSSLGTEGGVGRVGALAVSFAETAPTPYAAGIRLGIVDGGSGGAALSVNGQPGQEVIGILERFGGQGRDAVRLGAGGGPLGDNFDPDTPPAINNRYDTSGGRLLFGFDGDDVIYGSIYGFDTIFGGAGNDNIALGGASVLRAYGGAGEDLIYLTDLTGNHVILGGAGRDIISFRNSGPDTGQQGVYGRLDSPLIGPAPGLTLTIENIEGLEGTRGNDTLIGNSGDNILIGFGGRDSIEGAGGDDYIVTASALAGVPDSYDTTVDGGAGDDTILARGEATIRGGSGSDRLIAVSGDLAIAGAGAGAADTGRDVIAFGESGPVNLAMEREGIAQTVRAGLRITLTQIDDAEGTSGNDTISASDLRANRIDGRGGNDRLVAGSAGDTLIGGEGNDTLVGAPGAQRIEGGNGNDVFILSPGNDTMVGGAGNDRFEAGPGVNRIDGGTGTDTLEFGAALSAFAVIRNGAELTVSRNGETNTVADVEFFLFTDGQRTLSALLAEIEPGLVDPGPVDPDPDPVAPGPDAPGPVTPDPAPPTSGPTPGDDVLTGTNGPDRIAARAGDDTVRGLGGDDTLLGQQGDDVLRGAGGADRLNGGGGSDRLLGQGDDDTLKGGGGRDDLKGGGGSDRLIGGASADRIDGGRGADTLIGGASADVFRFAPGDGSDVIQRFQQGVDLVEFKRGVSGIEDLTITQQGDDVLLSYLRGSILFANQDAAAFGEEDFIF
ncbi:MAG: hypothetical protein ACE37J_08400 [Pikeienuella sp.]|uniref:hypothetical protein n=1 Tax=Pikeienuella sp. TaxID=2831957 RepID=UPI00391D135C